MAKLLKLRRGTTSQHSSFTGAEGEVTVDTTKDTAVIHDGSTSGGRPLLREDLDNMPASGVSAVLMALALLCLSLLLTRRDVLPQPQPLQSTALLSQTAPQTCLCGK